MVWGPSKTRAVRSPSVSRIERESTPSVHAPWQRKFHVGQVEGRQFERGCLVFAIRLEVVHPFEGGGFNAHTLDIDQRPPPGLETRRLQGQGLDLGQRLTPFGQAPFEAMEGDAKGGVVETDGPTRTRVAGASLGSIRSNWWTAKRTACR